MPLDFPSSPSLNDEYSFGGSTWRFNGVGWELVTGEVSIFTDLGDVPPAYTDEAGKLVAVTSGEDGLEFVDVVWDASNNGSLTVAGSIGATGGSVAVDYATPGVFFGKENLNDNRAIQIVTGGSAAYIDFAAAGEDYSGRIIVDVGANTLGFDAAGGHFFSQTVNVTGDVVASGDLTVSGGDLTVGASAALSDSAGTLTLKNVDAVDATTEATIEAAIDTLANLTSVQGTTITLADAGFDVLFGWDDSGSAYKNFSLASITTEASPATGDYVLIYGAEGDLRKVNWSGLPSGRTVLQADTTFYCRTDGSDSNNGLTNTSGGAFLTLQKAFDVLATQYDGGGKAVTIQLGAGLEWEIPLDGPNITAVVGVRELTILGNVSDPSTVRIKNHWQILSAVNCTLLDIIGVTLRCSGFKFEIDQPTFVTFKSCRWQPASAGACGIFMLGGAEVVIEDDHFIEAGSWDRWISVGVNSKLDFEFNPTITFDTSGGGVTFTGAFVEANCGGVITMFSTFVNTATGPAFKLSTGAIFNYANADPITDFMGDGTGDGTGLFYDGTSRSSVFKGTFTPTIDGDGSPTVTYTAREGNYQRFHNAVFFNLRIVINTISGGSGNALIGGMPYPMPATNVLVGAASSNGPNWAVNTTSLTAATYAAGGGTDDDTLQLLTSGDNVAQANVQVSDLAAGDVIRVSGWYNLS